MKVQYLLNGNEVNPINRRDISIEINHDQQSVIDQPRPHVGINNLYLSRKDVKQIMQYLATPPGITEGVPFDIVVTERGVSKTINMYIDMMEGFHRSRNGIEATVKMVQSLDWLDDKADSFTFESLYNETGVQTFTIDSVSYNSYQDYIDKKTIYVPYVLSTVPNYQDAFLALFSMTYIATQLYQCAKSIAQFASPSLGIGFSIPIAALVLEIAYSILLLTTLIALVNQLINSLIQPLKYHGAMLISDMLKLASVKMGLTFDSTVWNAAPFNQLAYIPEKFSPNTNAANIWQILGFNAGGFTANGYTSPAYAPSSIHNSNTNGIQHGWMNGTGADVFRLAKRLINGKITIEDGSNVLKMERRDYNFGTANYQLPPIRADWNGYNTDELTANILLKFQVDYTERNSVDYKTNTGVSFYTGTILQATHQQITTTNKALVSLKGVRQIDIPACRGVAKDRLTFVEKMIEDLQFIWDGIIALEDVGIAAINALIFVINTIIIPAINLLIGIWNLIISIIIVIADVINIIIDAIDTIPGIDIAEINTTPIDSLHVSGLSPISYISFIPFTSYDFGNRINALLTESDILNAPKVVMVDTARSEYVTSRIAYLHNDNRVVVNAQYLWDNYYFIDAFAGTINNRRTKIAPALNGPTQSNPVKIRLSEFKELVQYNNFTDQFGELVTADSVEWFIGQNGKANIHYRKNGWLKTPESENTFTRSQEIAINLKLTTSTPNGQ